MVTLNETDDIAGNLPTATHALDEKIRRLAIDRILDLEAELKQRGLRVRCGIEVEFFVDSEHGKPVEIPKDKLEAVRAQLKKSRYVEDLREENVQRSWTQPAFYTGIGGTLGAIGTAVTGDVSIWAISLGVGVAGAAVASLGLAENFKAQRLTKAAQYELNIGDTKAGEVKYGRTKRHALGPLKAAIATEYFQGRLKEILKDVGEVNLTAKPRNDYLTSAMHINVSLMDANGKNLFATPGGSESDLMKASTAKLVEVQKEGSILFLPNQNSHDRLQGGASAPRTIGRQSNKVNGMLAPAGTADARQANFSGRITGFLHGHPARPESNRIENRMPGADTDPYLAVLATMSALLSAVKAQEQGQKPEKPGRFPLPKRVEDSVRVFRRSELMQKVLGKELHSALVERYQAQHIGAER